MKEDLTVNDVSTAAAAIMRQRFLQAVPSERRTLAGERFALAGGDLIDTLTALYSAQPGFDAWLPELFDQLGRLHAQRSAELLALDAEREPTPNWFVRQRMLGYSAYVDRFAGTLQGVGERIDHLRALGVDYLHLLPFLRARSGDSDGGFAVASFDEVEPALGTMDQLESLTTQLRAAGISLCADLVLNHVADEHAWAQAAAAGDPAMRAFFHVFADRTQPDAYEAHLGEVFPEAAPGNFTYVAAMDGWVWTSFYPFQWDLNYAHPPVFAAMVTALLSLANRGVEIFRLDSAPFLWKRRGTACVNEPEVHRILAALRSCVQLVAPGVLLKAEAIVPTEQVVEYFGRGDFAGRECQLAYHSGLMAASWAAMAEGDAELPRELLSKTPAPPPNTGWVTYVRCHDDIVWSVLRPLVESLGDDFEKRIGKVAAFLEGRVSGSFARGRAFQTSDEDALHGTNGMTASLLGLTPNGSQSAALRRYVLMHALAFWMGAVPMIYMGDEFAQSNNGDPTDATRVASDSRWLQRPRLSDNASEATQQTPFMALRDLITRRRHSDWPDTQPASVVDVGKPGLLVVRRGDDAVGIFHFGHTDVTVDLASLGIDNPSVDLLSSGVIHDVDGKVTLLPWAAIWRLKKGD